jgi:O-methyltransferase
MDALQNLYTKLSPGGYVIVDDYGAVPACKQAVDDFRREHAITAKMEEIDWTGVYWKKTEASCAGVQSRTEPWCSRSGQLQTLG